jgi:hypothetical protein
VGKFKGPLAERLMALFLFGAHEMPDWFNKEKKEDPPVTKTPEQTSKEADELVSKLRLSVDEALKPFNERLDSFDTRFKTLESNTAKPAPKEEARTVPSVLDDEDGAFNARTAPLKEQTESVAVQTALLNARLTETEVLNEVASRGWGEIIPDVRAQLEQTPVQVKALPTYAQYVRNCVDMIVGRKAQAGGLKFDGSKKTFFLEDSSGKGGDGKSSGMAEGDAHYLRTKLGMTDAQIEAMQKAEAV